MSLVFLFQVVPGTLASQYFVPGDIVLGIQGYSAKDLLHVEAVDLVRQPVKNLALLVQKTDHISVSLWGPVPILRRPSQWLRHSSSTLASPYSDTKVEYQPASVMAQRSEALSEHFFQQKAAARTVYTPTFLDSHRNQHLKSLSENVSEASTEMPQTAYQAQMIDHVSSLTQHVNCDFSQAVATDITRYGDNTLCAQERSKILFGEVQQANHNLQELQESRKSISQIPHTTNNVYQSQESIRGIPEHGVQRGNIPLKGTQLSETSQNALLPQENINIFGITCNKGVIGSTKEQSNVKLGIPASRDADKHSPVRENTRTPTTADVLNRPIPPEFTMFPNSKSDSLLKLVLRKSLGNFSPEDFEKMKATAAPVHDESSDDADTEEDDNGDEDSESMSYDSSLAGSGSLIFGRYWMDDSDQAGYSHENGFLQQHCTYPDSVSRNTSWSSASSPLPNSASPSDDYTG